MGRAPWKVEFAKRSGATSYQLLTSQAQAQIEKRRKFHTFMIP